MDEGLEEAITSIIWATPRLQADIGELKVISEQLTAKFGKQYVAAVKENQFNTVNEKLIRKLSVQAPKRLLVEQYLIEIAKSHKVPYEPDPRVMVEESGTGTLLDFGMDHSRNLGPSVPTGGVGGGSSGSGGGGGGGFVAPPLSAVEPPPPIYPAPGQRFQDYENSSLDHSMEVIIFAWSV